MILLESNITPEFSEAISNGFMEAAKPIITVVVIIGIIEFLVEIIKVIIKKKKRNNKKNRHDFCRNKENVNVSQSKIIIQNAYEKTYLLTKNEWKFYKEIKPITDKYNLHILAKIRLNDLVNVKKDLEKSEYTKYLNKIQKKHIDFALCNPNNLEIIALVELDDDTHEKDDRKRRDEFINDLCKSVGYILIRTYDSNNFEKILIENNIINDIS